MKCKDCNYIDCPSRTSDTQKECVFASTIQFDEWKGVRIQAAIAALNGLLSCSYSKGTFTDYAKDAIKCADALVEELKKK